jgi:hypothetical protein
MEMTPNNAFERTGWLPTPSAQHPAAQLGR